jgi:hypothetical protein
MEIGEILNFRGDEETHFRFNPSRELSNTYVSKNYSTRYSTSVKNKNREDLEKLSLLYLLVYFAYP